MNRCSSNLVLMFLLSVLFWSCGSRSSDFTGAAGVENPLPPCPDSPNCVRTSRAYPDSIDTVWEALVTTLERMKPYDAEIDADVYRIDAVFLVVFFRDDLVVKLEQAPTGVKTETSTYLHLRSSSRVGYYDFGVNRRRVDAFFGLLEERL